MDPRKIDPSLGMLVGLSAERLQRVVEEGRMDLHLEGGEVLVTVSIRCRGTLPSLVGVEVLHEQHEITVARLRLSALGALSDLPEVIRITAVRGGKLSLNRSRAAIGATITDGQRIRVPAVDWNGSGVVVGVLDAGIDVYHPAFRQFPGGPTRIAQLWDRTIPATAVRPTDTAGLGGVGVVYTRAQIDAHLLGPAAAVPVLHPLTLDLAGHGSHTAGTAAGRSVVQTLPDGTVRSYQGIAPGADLIIVRTLDADLGQLHVLADWIFSQAGAPCAINISMGQFSGPHDGTSDLEAGLDNQLRDLASPAYAARPGRFIAVAAGNERERNWHAQVKVLPTGHLATQIPWLSPANNTQADEIELWYRGLDQIRVRLISPLDPATSPQSRTHWVAPDPAGCVEQVHPGGFAPVAAGPALSKVFNFSGGTVATVSHSENLVNQDRLILIRIEPPPGPPAGGVIAAGRWFFELEGINDLPAGGVVDGYVRDDVVDAPSNTRFLAPRLVGVDRVVPALGELSLDVFVPDRTAAPVTVQLEYPASHTLHARLRPNFFFSANPTQFVGVGLSLEATPAPFTAPAMAAGVPVVDINGLRFDLGASVVRLAHTAVGGAKRVQVLLDGAPPEPGLCRLTLRNPGSEPVPVSARLVQEPVPGDLAIFFDEPNAEGTLSVLPEACLESQVVFDYGVDFSESDIVRIAVPAAAIGPAPRGVEVRVRVPPLDAGQDASGFVFTPWVGPGETETAVPGSAAVVGGAPGARTYAFDGVDVIITYPAPAAAAAGAIEVQFNGGAVRFNQGRYRIELRGRGLNAPVEVTTSLEHHLDWGVGHGVFGIPLQPGLFRQQHVLDAGMDRLSVPFVIDRPTSDAVRFEVLYESRHELKVRLVLPDATSTPLLGTGPAAAQALGGGVSARVEHDAADVFPGQRRALITISGAVAPAVYLPRGIGRIDIEPVRLDGSARLLVSLRADGHTPHFFMANEPGADLELGAISVPGTAREIMSVANAVLDLGDTTAMSSDSAAGPPRTATQTQVASLDRQWTAYPKPELAAPGTAISAPMSSSMAIWTNREERLGWRTLDMSGARTFGMRAAFPVLDPGGRVQTQAIPRPGGAAFLERDWSFVLPTGVDVELRLEVRYDPGVACQLRVDQPAGAAAANRTHAVDAAGALVALAGAGVAAGVAAWPHPDGPGQVFTMHDNSSVVLRQNGAGRASVVLRPEPGGRLRAGGWTLHVRHQLPAGAALPVTVEAMPPLDIRGFPKLQLGGALGMRLDFPLAAATGAGPALAAFIIAVPPRLARDVAVHVTYPASPVGPGAYNVSVLAIRPRATITSPMVAGAFTGDVHAGGATGTGGGAVAVQQALPSGARFQFGAPVAGDAFGAAAQGNRVSIVHAAGDLRITLNRGVAASASIAEGEWVILIGNSTVGFPAVPITMRAELVAVPHDAPFFRARAGEAHPATFAKQERLVMGSVATWPFQMPEGRRDTLRLDVVYDVGGDVLVQVEAPTGERTDAVSSGNVVVAGNGATLHDAAAAAAPAARVFLSPDRFEVTVDHGVHPLAATRKRARIAIASRGQEPLPAGDWSLRLTPQAVAGNGVVEAWLEDMLIVSLSGTSMASPHVAGTAALLLQQDHAQTHDDLKRRMIASAEPMAIVRSGDRQLPKQWNPVAGWGFLRADRALLGHTGGPLHRRGFLPLAVGETTGCPVACEDNCLLQAKRDDGGVVRDLIRAPRALHNLSPEKLGADRLPPCPRLTGYLSRYHGATGYRGGATARFETLNTTALDRPLKRDRSARDGLNGFVETTWDDAYQTIATRLVEQWADSCEILTIEGMPERGVVREALWNRLLHHLHRLLTATNKVKKCGFTSKHAVSQLSPRVPWGEPFSDAVYGAFGGMLTGTAEASHGSGDLSLARNIVIWGANLGANASAVWRGVQAARDAQGERLRVFVIDPAPRGVPSYVKTLPIAPAGDRHLALALMLRLCGNPAHADAARQIPPDPRFADAARGISRLLTAQAQHLTEFIEHVRSTAASYLRMNGSDVLLDRAITELFLPGVDPATATATQTAQLTRLQHSFDQLYDAYVSGPTATLLGSGPSRYVEGEEHVQYLVALSFLSGNLGVPGGGISFGEDRVRALNTSAFAGAHDTLRPEDNTAQMGEAATQQTLDLASIGADAADTTKVALWFDLDPLTQLPDSEALETRLGGTQLNVQITSSLDDSSRLADVILPMADTLQSFDLQTGKRSAWLNLTQPLLPRDATGPRPPARIFHELFAAVRARLVDQFHGDLQPIIDEDLYKRGPLLLSATRMQELSDFILSAERIPGLLADRLPSAEIQNLHQQLQDFYRGVAGSEPTTNTASAVAFGDAQKFFDRMQLDWVLELLLANFSERDVPLVLYELLVRGTVLDRREFQGSRIGIYPDGGTPRGLSVRSAAPVRQHIELRGAAGFEPTNAVYRDAVVTLDASASGRSAYPMRLVIAQSLNYASTHIPLETQVRTGTAIPPTVVLNPSSPSVLALGLAAGDAVTLIGNLGFSAAHPYEAVIANASVELDATMAQETLLFSPGWSSLGRGGQRLARALHSEEGEVPALFDNLVRLERATTPSHTALRTADTGRGTPPPKHSGGGH